MSNIKYTINLSNSIVGVSLLAMPYCFKNCGIILSLLLILLSSLINRLGCYLLIKSSKYVRSRNFEFLAFHAFGPFGKLLVEFSILGYLLGSCVAMFIIIGDLGPSLLHELYGVEPSHHLRTFILTFLGMCITLPLGLLRRVESFTSFSAASLALYLFLIFKLILEAFKHMNSTNTELLKSRITLWDTSGLLSALPIFAMGLSAQSQLFEIFGAQIIFSDDLRSNERLNRIIKNAIYMCTIFYVTVGIFGYISFEERTFHGNILLALPASFSSTLTKLGFLFTIIISLPLCLFPCRTSLYSLLYRNINHYYSTSSLLASELAANSVNSSEEQSNSSVNTANIYMSDRHFNVLTVLLIVVSISISIVLPSVELILSVIGSTMGALICFILPAAIYLNLTSGSSHVGIGLSEHNKNLTGIGGKNNFHLKQMNIDRLFANILLLIGVFILFACSLQTLNDTKLFKSSNPFLERLEHIDINSRLHIIDKKFNTKLLPTVKKAITSDRLKDKVIIDDNFGKLKTINTLVNINGKNIISKTNNNDNNNKANSNQENTSNNNNNNAVKNKNVDNEKNLLKIIEKQQEEQKKLLEQGKQLLKEIKEQHKELHKEIKSNDMKINNLNKISVDKSKNNDENNNSINKDINNKQHIVDIENANRVNNININKDDNLNKLVENKKLVKSIDNNNKLDKRTVNADIDSKELEKINLNNLVNNNIEAKNKYSVNNNNKNNNNLNHKVNNKNDNNGKQIETQILNKNMNNKQHMNSPVISSSIIESVSKKVNKTVLVNNNSNNNKQEEVGKDQESKQAKKLLTNDREI